jgi:hypothetical protein
METALGSNLSYTWTCWQSEWATDFIFADSQELQKIIDRQVKHAFLCTAKISTPLNDLIKTVTQTTYKNGQRIRALDPSKKFILKPLLTFKQIFIN